MTNPSREPWKAGNQTINFGSILTLNTLDEKKLEEYVRTLLLSQQEELIERVEKKIELMREILWHPDIKKHTQRIAREDTLNKVLAEVRSLRTN